MAEEKNLSDQLRDRIRKSDRSYASLARAAGLREATISDFMRGRHDLTLGTASGIAAELGVRLTMLPPGAKRRRDS